MTFIHAPDNLQCKLKINSTLKYIQIEVYVIIESIFSILRLIISISLMYRHWEGILKESTSANQRQYQVDAEFFECCLSMLTENDKFSMTSDVKNSRALIFTFFFIFIYFLPLFFFFFLILFFGFLTRPFCYAVLYTPVGIGADFYALVTVAC